MNNAFQIISSIDRGRVAAELHEAIVEVAKAVSEHRIKGQVVFSITVKPAGDGYEFAAKIAAKVPKRELKPSIFFIDEDGNISREDPNQPELPVVTKLSQGK